ncbi:C40 family peptidase [Lentibacter algarum]|nr:C40 family peptidase [Lentibacter algarum]
MQVIHPSTTIFSESGRREREVLFGQTVVVTDKTPDEAGRVVGHSLGNGYAGFFDLGALDNVTEAATHVVSARLSYALDIPDFKTQGEHFPLSLGARVFVVGTEGRWSEISCGSLRRFVPTAHLRPVSDAETDPVSVAERLLGTPYVWGGDSAFGIDCSGLVHAGCMACGIPCPGDSGPQEAELGVALTQGAALKRGDVLFWKGHVAWVSDSETLLHANAYHMNVAYEPIKAAIARIKAQGDGPVTARKRVGRET